jgi:Transposase, Mutator family
LSDSLDFSDRDLKLFGNLFDRKTIPSVAQRRASSGENDARSGAIKVDRSGHSRQVRQAEERMILASLAVWEDGSYSLLHYEIAAAEGEAEWAAFFDPLIERGLASWNFRKRFP